MNYSLRQIQDLAERLKMQSVLLRYAVHLNRYGQLLPDGLLDIMEKESLAIQKELDTAPSSASTYVPPKTILDARAYSTRKHDL